jgi:type II secretory pathway pseudopilin PulG
MITTHQHQPTIPKSRKGFHPSVIICFVVIGIVTLVLAAFLIWRVNLNSRISAKVNAIRHAGQPTTARELDHYYAEVPKAENAALLWMQGVSQLRPAYARNKPLPWNRIKHPERGAKLTPKELKEAEEVLQENEQALRTFQAAAGLKKARYPVDLAPGLAALLPHLGQLKSVGQLLRVKLDVAAETGKKVEAIQAIFTILGAAESLKAEPILISQLVRFSLDGMACLSLETSVNALNLQENELAALQNAFGAEIDEEQFYLSMLGERALGLTVYSHPEAMDGEGVQDMKVLSSPLVQATGFLERDMLFFLTAMETNLAVSRLPDPQRLKSTNSFEDIAVKSKKGYYVVSSMLLPALSKAVVRDVENRARLRAAQTGMAVERYRLANGKLPGTLETLVPRFLKSVPLDPIDGEPLRYRILTNGYVVYSIGSDAQDDGGTPKPTSKKHQSDPYDLTFTVERSEAGH